MLTKLIRGTDGHPAHPPLTDATIGMFVLAAGLAVIGYAGGLGSALAAGGWLGGSLVFVHGMRVLESGADAADAPARAESKELAGISAGGTRR